MVPGVFKVVRKIARRLSALSLMVLSACGLTKCAPDPADKATIERLYAETNPPSDQALSVYFIGHSLVGRDMPAMLAQLAPDEHRYESQLGWGSEMQAHWEPDIELTGGEFENAHDRFREAHEAVGSGDYDAIVLTEKVSLTDAIKYHESWRYLALWSEKAWQANPDTRIYFYETWHETDIADGWMNRVDNDLSELWEKEITDRALTETGAQRPIYIIPAGQVMARFVRAAQDRGGVDGLSTVEDLFDDNIHPNDLGTYLNAITHYAVVYGKSPVGLPYALNRADGSPAAAPGADAARLMQEVVWEVVTSYPRSGVQPDG